jgi:hypothetical protein
MKNLKRFFASALLGGVLSFTPAIAQTSPELSFPEANRIPVPAPTHLRIENHDGHRQLVWDPSRLKRVTGYEVFQKTANGASVQVAKVDQPSFEITAPGEYFVVAVDYRNNHSKPSESIAVGNSAPPQNPRP